MRRHALTFRKNQDWQPVLILNVLFQSEGKKTKVKTRKYKHKDNMEKEDLHHQTGVSSGIVAVSSGTDILNLQDNSKGNTIRTHLGPTLGVGCHRLCELVRQTQFYNTQTTLWETTSADGAARHVTHHSGILLLASNIKASPDASFP